MADKVKTTTAEKLNSGVKTIVSDVEVCCDKIKALGDNNELYDQMQNIIKSLSTKGENIDFATKISNIEESVNNEQSFYLNKTGVSLSVLPENKLLESAANILLETGIDDYKSNSLFIKYMDMIENCKKQKDLNDDIDEHIDKLKKVIELQNDLKCELSNINYSPVGYIPKPINIKTNEGGPCVDNCKEIVELVKKIADIEKKQADVCTKTSELSALQKKMYHGLPPNMDQAIMAVQLAEQQMKSITKKLIEKLDSKG